MADTVFKLGKERQGHPDVEAKLPTESITESNLPTIIQMGDETSVKRTLNAAMNPELHWFHKLSQAVMLAFQPETYKTAQDCIKIFETCASQAVQDRIKSSANAFKHGKSEMFINWFTDN